MLVTSSQTSTSYTSNLGRTLLKLNINTKFLLTPDEFQLRNSRSETMCMSRPNSSIQSNPPRNYLISSLGCTKSLCSRAPTPSPYDFLIASMLNTQFSTYPCWNQQPQT